LLQARLVDLALGVAANDLRLSDIAGTSDQMGTALVDLGRT
jgi:hypothetical protein